MSGVMLQGGETPTKCRVRKDEYSGKKTAVLQNQPMFNDGMKDAAWCWQEPWWWHRHSAPLWITALKSKEREREGRWLLSWLKILDDRASAFRALFSHNQRNSPRDRLSVTLIPGVAWLPSWQPAWSFQVVAAQRDLRDAGKAFPKCWVSDLTQGPKFTP